MRCASWCRSWTGMPTFAWPSSRSARRVPVAAGESPASAALDDLLELAPPERRGARRGTAVPEARRPVEGENPVDVDIRLGGQPDRQGLGQALAHHCKVRPTAERLRSGRAPTASPQWHREDLATTNPFVGRRATGVGSRAAVGVAALLLVLTSAFVGGQLDRHQLRLDVWSAHPSRRVARRRRPAQLPRGDGGPRDGQRRDARRRACPRLPRRPPGTVLGHAGDDGPRILATASATCL